MISAVADNFAKTIDGPTVPAVAHCYYSTGTGELGFLQSGYSVNVGSSVTIRLGFGQPSGTGAFGVPIKVVRQR